MTNLQELAVAANTAQEIIDATEQVAGEITDGAFVCDECGEEWELEQDILIFGLCGNCYTKGEVMQ